LCTGNLTGRDAREPQDQFPNLRVERRSTGPLPRLSPSARDDPPVPAQDVSGVTRSAYHERRGMTLLSVASSSRSLSASFGRRACRRRIDSSWRNTRSRVPSSSRCARAARRERTDDTRPRKRTTRARATAEHVSLRRYGAASQRVPSLAIEFVHPAPDPRPAAAAERPTAAGPEARGEEGGSLPLSRCSRRSARRASGPASCRQWAAEPPRAPVGCQNSVRASRN
jgi:hypothetical protein